MPPAGAATGSRLVQPQSPGSSPQLSTPSAVFRSSPTIMARGETSRPGESNQLLRSAPREMQTGLGGGLSAVSTPASFPLGPLCQWPWSGWGLCLLKPTGSVDMVAGRGVQGQEAGTGAELPGAQFGLRTFFLCSQTQLYVCLLKGSREYLCSAQRGWPLSTFPLLPFPITTSEAPVIYTSQDALLQLLYDGSSLHH